MDFIVLRLLHIVGGIFWVGSAFTLFLFLQPTARATGRDGQRFMLHLTRNRRFTEVGLASAVVTVVAGLILIWRDTNGLQIDLLTRPPGLGFALGGLAAMVALLLFAFLGYPNARRIVKIGGRLEAEQRPPTEDEQRAIGTAERTLGPVGTTVLVLLTIAAVSMSTARYWGLVL